MNKIYKAFGVVFLLLAFMAMNVNSQIRYVDVLPGIGTLNDAIWGDTTVTGDRIDPDNTVYRLQRGDQAYYGLEGQIKNEFPLTIVAADGDGAMPYLQPRLVNLESSRPFRPKDDITLKGLHVTSLDEAGALIDHMLRCDASGIRVTIDDCWFDQSGQSFIRTDDPDMVIKVTNTVVSNIGHPRSPNNGRGIDDRGVDIDTIIIENCTFFNLTSRVIRDDGGVINYLYMNNNTVVNVAQMGVTFGPVDTAIVTNNILMNCGFMPKDDDNDEWFVLGADSVGGVAPYVVMTNNSAYMDTTKMVGYLNDTLSITPLMNPTLELAVVAAGNEDDNDNWIFKFTDGAPFNDSILMYYYDPAYMGGDAPAWEVPEIPSVGEGGNGLYHTAIYYDFGWAHTEALTGATDGGQLGDRNWSASSTVGVKPILKEGVALSVYPMPVQNQATVSFELKADARVRMEVYSLTGQRVAEVINTTYPAGVHQYNWNAEMLETGMYLLRMKAGKESSTIKMIIQ